jgi:predicted ATPase
MLKAIELERFKCFRELVLPLRHPALVTGVNASGNSRGNIDHWPEGFF